MYEIDSETNKIQNKHLFQQFDELFPRNYHIFSYMYLCINEHKADSACILLWHVYRFLTSIDSIQQNGGSSASNFFPKYLNCIYELIAFRQYCVHPKEHLVEFRIHSQQKGIVFYQTI